MYCVYCLILIGKGYRAVSLCFQIADTFPGPRIMKTHLPLRYFKSKLDNNPSVKVIQVLRNPRDTFVSLYRYITSSINTLPGVLLHHGSGIRLIHLKMRTWQVFVKYELFLSNFVNFGCSKFIYVSNDTYESQS